MARASRDIAFCTRRGAPIALERFGGALGDLECFFGAFGDMSSPSRATRSRRIVALVSVQPESTSRNAVPPHSTHAIALAIKNAAALLMQALALRGYQKQDPANHYRPD